MHSKEKYKLFFLIFYNIVFFLQCKKNIDLMVKISHSLLLDVHISGREGENIRNKELK